MTEQESGAGQGFPGTHQAGGPARRADWRHVPAPSRLAPTNPHYPEIVARHDTSLASGIPTYIDPLSGFSVFTADFLEQRNYCCDSGCRHCPYDC